MCGLLPNSAAMECGKISIGDQIIEVNGVDMRNATVDEAADIMVSLGSTCSITFQLRLHICRMPDFFIIDTHPNFAGFRCF